MNDSYTRHACGIRTFTPTRASRLIDAAVFVAGWAALGAKVATLIF